MNGNVTAWEAPQRRVASYVVLGLAVAIVAAGFIVWALLESTPDWVYWALVAALGLVLAFMVVVLFTEPRVTTADAPETAAAAAAGPVPEASSTETTAPTAFEPRILTLRCGDCGTIFDVTDTGERPLYHTCPGCGAEGALRDPVEAAPAAEAEPSPSSYAPPPEQAGSAYAPTSAYAPPPDVAAEATPTPPVVKKLKLRCGGCKEVFSIEDTGERPLKRACPHCGRIGKIG